MKQRKNNRIGRPKVRIVDSLEENKDKIVPNEKLEQATKTLNRVGLPKEFNRK